MDKFKYSKNSVTLEDLLKWKKFEKPDTVLFKDFEKKVRSRAVQTIVENPSFLKRIQKLLTSRATLSYSLPSFALLITLTWSFPHLMTLTNKNINVTEKPNSIVVAKQKSILHGSLLVEATSRDADLLSDTKSDFFVDSTYQKPYQQVFTLNKSFAYSENLSSNDSELLASLESKKSKLVNLEF